MLFSNSSTTSFAGILPIHNRDTSCGPWTVVSSPNPGSSANFLNAVAAIGTGNAWAVGSYSNGNGSFPLIEHWSYSRWTVIPGPAISGSLAGVAAIAVSYSTLVEHWNGKQWSVVNSPSPGSIDSDLVASAGIPPTGYLDGTPARYLDGTPARGVATGLSNHIWAVGNTFDGFTYQTLVEKC